MAPADPMTPAGARIAVLASGGGWAERRTVGRGLWKWSHYLQTYERHLSKFVDHEVTVVEIGVYSGGSLDMWRDYFGPRSTIIGVDIAEECRAYADDQVVIEIGDQADPSFWEAFLARHPTIDVVIDDGGHLAAQQVATLEALLPRLSRGGVYICEDIGGVHNPFQDYVAGLSRNLNRWDSPDPRQPRTIPGPLQSTVASIHHYPYLVVIERTVEEPTAFESPRRGTEWVPF